MSDTHNTTANTPKCVYDDCDTACDTNPKTGNAYRTCKSHRTRCRNWNSCSGVRGYNKSTKIIYPMCSRCNFGDKYKPSTDLGKKSPPASSD